MSDLTYTLTPTGTAREGGVVVVVRGVGATQLNKHPV